VPTRIRHRRLAQLHPWQPLRVQAIEDAGGQEPLWEELDLFAERSSIPSAEIPAEAIEARESARPGQARSGDSTERVLAVLGAAPAALDDIVRGCGLPASAVRATLLELELAGRITRSGGDLVQLAL